MNKEVMCLPAKYFNIAVTGLEILYETSRIDPGAIEELGDIARRVVELTGKRTFRLSARTLHELAEEAGVALDSTQEARAKKAKAEGRKQRRRRKA